MNVNDRINYLTQVLSDLIYKSKNIGQLEAHDLSTGNPSNELFAAIYNPVNSKTKKINLVDFFKQEVGDIPHHVHSHLDITGIGDYKILALEDTNDLVWSARRLISDETDDSFKTDDYIKGFIDASKTTYISAIILDDNVSIPADLYDKTKVFIINEITNI